MIGFQAKAFELSDFYAKLESARLMLYKACWLIDRGEDFREASSLAKYLSVKVAREVTLWAADIFGAEMRAEYVVRGKGKGERGNGKGR